MMSKCLDEQWQGVLMQIKYMIYCLRMCIETNGT
jgi:hypothetical protein